MKPKNLEYFSSNFSIVKDMLVEIIENQSPRMNCKPDDKVFSRLEMDEMESALDREYDECEAHLMNQLYDMEKAWKEETEECQSIDDEVEEFIDAILLKLDNYQSKIIEQQVEIDLLKMDKHTVASWKHGNLVAAV